MKSEKNYYKQIKTVMPAAEILFWEMAINIMKKFVVAALAALCAMCVVAVSPVAPNPADPESGGELLAGATFAILLLSIASVTNGKLLRAVLLLAGYGIAVIFGLWAVAVAMIYSVVASYLGTNEVREWMKSFIHEDEEEELLP